MNVEIGNDNGRDDKRLSRRRTEKGNRDDSDEEEDDSMCKRQRDEREDSPIRYDRRPKDELKDDVDDKRDDRRERRRRNDSDDDTGRDGRIQRSSKDEREDDDEKDDRKESRKNESQVDEDDEKDDRRKRRRRHEGEASDVKDDRKERKRRLDDDEKVHKRREDEQMASPGFTDAFAALVAIVNTKFPEVDDLLLRRIMLQLQRAYKRNDKPQLLAGVKFIAHLVNQQISLELLTVLLEKPTDDSVEVAVGEKKRDLRLLRNLKTGFGTPRGNPCVSRREDLGVLGFEAKPKRAAARPSEHGSWATQVGSVSMELADRAVGLLLTLTSLSIFTYYTFWVIILVVIFLSPGIGTLRRGIPEIVRTIPATAFSRGPRDCCTGWSSISNLSPHSSTNVIGLSSKSPSFWYENISRIIE
ncbi:hypothetical protein RND71_032347 [Anisodus tanguticus]|uniref:Uncharacterized protein n=1 Tax=Anisodus tanguticus TaxID=243964 RepID=A0AAE1RF94_9SOLA|nr:hypothetical protein RND71_032347 [Anisodus tanguticus]